MFSLLELGHPSPALDIGSPGSEAFTLELGLRLLAVMVLEFGMELHYLLSWASGLQKAGHGTSQPPQLHEPTTHNNNSLPVYLYISYWFSSLENLTNTAGL